MPSIDNAVIVLVVKLKLLQKLAQMPVVFCLFTITSIYISFATLSIVTSLFINPESLLVTPHEKLPASIVVSAFPFPSKSVTAFAETVSLALPE